MEQTFGQIMRDVWEVTTLRSGDTLGHLPPVTFSADTDSDGRRWFATGRPGSVMAANYLHARINEAKWWDRIGTFGQPR